MTSLSLAANNAAAEKQPVDLPKALTLQDVHDAVLRGRTWSVSATVVSTLLLGGLIGMAWSSVEQRVQPRTSTVVEETKKNLDRLQEADRLLQPYYEKALNNEVVRSQRERHPARDDGGLLTVPVR